MKLTGVISFSGAELVVIIAFGTIIFDGVAVVITVGKKFTEGVYEYHPPPPPPLPTPEVVTVLSELVVLFPAASTEITR